MERFLPLLQGAPRATLAIPLLLVEAALVLVVLGLLGPAVFMRNREPFDRLMEFLALLLGRARGEAQPSAMPVARQKPPAAA